MNSLKVSVGDYNSDFAEINDEKLMLSLEADWQVVGTTYWAEANRIIFSWHWLL